MRIKLGPFRIIRYFSRDGRLLLLPVSHHLKRIWGFEHVYEVYKITSQPHSWHVRKRHSPKTLWTWTCKKILRCCSCYGERLDKGAQKQRSLGNFSVQLSILVVGKICIKFMPNWQRSAESEARTKDQKYSTLIIMCSCQCQHGLSTASNVLGSPLFSPLVGLSSLTLLWFYLFQLFNWCNFWRTHTPITALWTHTLHCGSVALLLLDDGMTNSVGFAELLCAHGIRDNSADAWRYCYLFKKFDLN